MKGTKEERLEDIEKEVSLERQYFPNKVQMLILRTKVAEKAVYLWQNLMVYSPGWVSALDTFSKT